MWIFWPYCPCSSEARAAELMAAADSSVDSSEDYTASLESGSPDGEVRRRFPGVGFPGEPPRSQA